LAKLLKINLVLGSKILKFYRHCWCLVRLTAGQLTVRPIDCEEPIDSASTDPRPFDHRFLYIFRLSTFDRGPIKTAGFFRQNRELGGANWNTHKFIGPVNDAHTF
jgi:hypothetical protein